MDSKFKQGFIDRWKRYFNDAEPPITLCFTDKEEGLEPAKAGSLPRCLIAALSQVREGKPLCLDADNVFVQE